MLLETTPLVGCCACTGSLEQSGSLILFVKRKMRLGCRRGASAYHDFVRSVQTNTMSRKVLLPLFLVLVLHLERAQSSSSQGSYYPDPPPRGRLPQRPPPPPPANDNNDFLYTPPQDQEDADIAYEYPNNENPTRWDQRDTPAAMANKINRGTPPPPPPPPGASRAAAAGYDPPPIHYQFHQKDLQPPPSARRGGRRPPVDEANDDGIPRTLRLDETRPQRRPQDDDATLKFASARRDAITIFMDRSIINRWMVRLAAGAVGAVFITFIGTSLTTKKWWTLYAWMGFWLFLITTWFRTPYGELCRACGFLLLETIRESRAVRRDYPTRPHLKALLGAGPRRPFPPADNVWNYVPQSPKDPPFSMLWSVLAMTVVGSFCGGNVPLVPSWLGALVGAGFMGLLTTRPNARGDLSRATGMRVVATIQTLWDLQREMNLSPKVWKVASLLLDKLLILDRQHRLKDRLVAFLSFVYDQMMRMVNQVQQQQPPPRRSDDRRRERPPLRKGNNGMEGDQPRRPPQPRGGPRRERPLEADDDFPRSPRVDRDVQFDNFGRGGDVSDDDYYADEPPPSRKPKKRRGFLGF